MEYWRDGSPGPLFQHSIIPILQFYVSLTKKESAFIRFARVAHLATADETGQPHVIPICFAFDGKHFYSPIDEKPKRTRELKRLRNIKANPSVSLVVDHYDEDWRKLAYVLIFGKAKVLAGGVKHQRAVELLRGKYPQYRSMNIHRLPVILITPTRVRCWGAI